MSMLSASRRPIIGRLCIGSGDMVSWSDDLSQIISCRLLLLLVYSCGCVVTDEEFGKLTIEVVVDAPVSNSGMLCPKLSCPCVFKKNPNEKKNNKYRISGK